MNKTLKKSLLGCTLVLGTFMVTTSCNSLFDDAPIDKISEESTWTNSMLLDEYVNAWYRNADNGFSVYVPSNSLLRGISRYYLPWFGDQMTVSKTDWFNSGYGDVLKDEEQSITSYSLNLWSTYYTQITSINDFFTNESKVTDESQRTRIEGEAHFFRGLYYFLLWRRFGGVLLRDHNVDPLENAEKFPRASYQEMLDFIVSEADKAAEILPVSYSSENVGRATKGAALMLKAKAYQWAAGDAFQNKEKDYLGFTDDRRTEMLTQAKKAFEDIINLGAYSLIQITSTDQDGIKNEYRNIFLTKNSNESIWEVQHSDDGDFVNGFGHKLDRYAAAPFFTGTTAAFVPTQNHVNEYGMRDGATYDAKNPYLNRDYRFYANVLYNGSIYKSHVMDMATTDGVAGVDIKPYGSSTSAAYSRTGYYLGKFVDESQAIDDDDTYGSKQNCIIWRYAEVLLDYAETCYKLGDEATALNMVNQIRSRVHMNQLTTIDWDAIVNERRVELAFEPSTYWDLIRWGVAGEKMSGKTNPLYGVTLTVTNGDTTYSYPKLNRFPSRVRKFNDRDYYYPIPWSDIKYQGIEQNPGWSEQ